MACGSTAGPPSADTVLADAGNVTAEPIDPRPDVAPDSTNIGADTAGSDVEVAPDAGSADASGKVDDAGADAASSDGAALDAIDVAEATPVPEAATLGPPVTAQVEVLWTKQSVFVAPGAGSMVLAQAGTETVWLDAGGGLPTALAGDPGIGRSLAVMPGPTYLLATDKGLYGLQGKKWGLSPVQAWIGAPPAWLTVQPAAADGGPWLWLGQASALWRHDGVQLQPIALPGLDLTSALPSGGHWSPGPSVLVDSAGKPSPAGKQASVLWFVAAGQARALVVTGTKAVAWPDAPLPVGTRLVGDGGGRLQWLGADGTLHDRSSDGTWRWLALPEAVTEIAARPDVPFGAVQTNSGLWLQQGGVFFAISGTAGLKLRGLLADGALLAVGAKGVLRVTTGQPTPPPPPPSWTKAVQPIFAAKCAICHGPAAVTVKLHTAALWKQWIVAIQQQLATDAMPLVGSKLSAADKALIKAWATGGFAP